MREYRSQVDSLRSLVDCCCLHGCNLVPPKRRPNDFQAARQGGVSKAPLWLITAIRTDRPDQRLFRIYQLGLGLCERTSESGDGVARTVHGRPPVAARSSRLPIWSVSHKRRDRLPPSHLLEPSA